MISTGKQIRAARAMLGLRREDLATAAGLHPNAVNYWEARGVPHDRVELIRTGTHSDLYPRADPLKITCGAYGNWKKTMSSSNPETAETDRMVA